jgi:hypothetical protein
LENYQSKHNTAYSKTGKTIEKLEDELNKIEEEKQELNLINY